MRFSFIFLALIAICITGCSGSGESTNAPTPAAFVAPTNYAAATRLAVDPPSAIGLPVGPWDCEPVVVIGTPGMVLARHGRDGAITTYTAGADGRFVNATGGMLDMLTPPRFTLWLTVVSPTDAIVEWSGAQFTSVDATGATWTSPEDANFTHPATVIRVTVTVAPSGNG